MTAESRHVRSTFGYHERLHHLKDFQRVLKSGRRLVHPALFIYIYKREDSSPLRRLGLVTNRKVGTAVERNRLKRRFREIFRLNKHRLVPGVDIIFVARPGGKALNYHQLEAVILSLWQRAQVMAQE